VECPYCGADSRVLDSRRSGDDVRRRRECLECERRFTTYERVAQPEIRVAKRSAREGEDFDRKKLLRVVLRVTRGRPVGRKACDDLVRGLEAELVDSGVQTIEASRLAERLYERLRELDGLAADRFASNWVQEDGSIRFADERSSPQLPLPITTPSPSPASERATPQATPRPRARRPR
jgi:transcriptional repressor NrdR